MHYPLVHQSSQRPYHFIHGYVQYLEQQLRLSIPVTRFQGDLYLAEHEKLLPAALADFGIRDGFWIIVAGGKYDFTCKWWNPASYQKVVDHFRGVIQFVQCGEAGHWHPPLDGVINLVGKTSTREFIRLMYHADGVLCPVTFAMHLAAAVPTPPSAIGARACVVIAGGRESPHWEAYPQHQFLHTVGALRCCAQGGCWKSRCQLVGDGDGKDRQNVCEQPVQITPELRIPRCMEMITPDNVIRRIALYLDGGAIPPAPHVNGSARRLPVETPATKAQATAAADAASTGTERPLTQAAPATNAEYWADLRPIETVTLEQLAEKYGLDRIDFLKLDCEGSEFSILQNTTMLDRIGVIVGEYHDRARFLKLVTERFADWALRILKDGELGVFWLTNPRAVGQAFQSDARVTVSQAGKPDLRAEATP